MSALRWTPEEYREWQRSGAEPKRNAARANKYNAKKTEVDGIVFDSKKEAARYQVLRLMENAGEISNLCCQFDVPLHVSGVRVAAIRLDFVYTGRDGRQVYEDSKGVRTPVYKLKKRMFEAQYQLKILET